MSLLWIMLIWFFELIYTSSLSIYLIFMNILFDLFIIFLDILVINDVLWVLINFVRFKQTIYWYKLHGFIFFFFAICNCGRVALIKEICLNQYFRFFSDEFALYFNKSIDLLWSKLRKYKRKNFLKICTITKCCHST